jgi:isoquinoline 1-oxidoreductase alpha subunit
LDIDSTEASVPKYSFTVNGERRQVEALSDTPLLWVLRENLAMTGTKYGCGVGVCGACAVHENGELKRACQIPVSEANGRSYVTIEGLGKNGLHPVQQAWIEEDVSQCGYCQAGMIMTAAALLKAHPKPTDAQVDEAMSNSVCRCGTYQRMRKAIHRASTSQAAKGGKA